MCLIRKAVLLNVNHLVSIGAGVVTWLDLLFSSLAYLAFINLSNFFPGPMDVSCCSSFIQSLLTGQFSADLGRSPDCLLFHWEIEARPQQTQFGIITGLLEEMCDHTTHVRHIHTFVCSHSRMQCLLSSLHSPQSSHLSSIHTLSLPPSVLPGGHISTCSPSNRRNFKELWN